MINDEQKLKDELNIKTELTDFLLQRLAQSPAVCRYRTVIVHGISTVGKSHLDKDQETKSKMFASGIDMWDTDNLPKLLFGSFKAAGHLQGPVDPERSEECAEAFNDLIERRLRYVQPRSSVMLVLTNNVPIVRQWKDLVLCSFTRPKEDVVRLRMDREQLDRSTILDLMKDWIFELPSTLDVPSITLARDEYLNDYADTLVEAISMARNRRVDVLPCRAEDTRPTNAEDIHHESQLH